MNILVITNNPNRASFRQRIEVYLDTLRTNGIDSEVAKLPSSYLARRKLFKRAADFDAVFLQKKGLNLFDAFWLRRYSKKIIYNFDDAVMYSDKKPELDSPSHFIPFRRSVKLADMVIVGSSYLADHAQKFNPNVKVLPLGLKVSDYKIDCPPKNDGKIRLVWIGSESTLHYLAEIEPALEEIGLRFDNVVLRIICDDFFDLQNMEVEKRLWSKETRAFDLATSDIGLAPLPDNRFTRGKCSFKVLEYSSTGLPVVASPVGTNPDHIRENITGFFATDTDQWIAKISQLIEQQNLRKQMADAGRAHAERFDTSIIGEKLCSLITECIQGLSIGVKQVEYSGNRTEKPTRLQKNTVTVSVCIPTYNRKDYLKETLDSILAQTYKDYEIVIVDDGSTDGTADMIKQLNFPVTYYWQENSGDAAARNKLIELARGQYISFIDSDDLLLPDAIERMVKVMEAEGRDTIVYGSYFRIDENGKVYGRCKRKLRSGNITRYLFQTIHVHSCGSMFPKKILKAPTAFDTSLRICSDYDLWLRLSLEYPFIALSEPTFKRRRHTANLSAPSFENRLTELLVLKDFYYKKGGNKAVSEKTAIKVFSKEECRAGRYAIKEGLHDKACRLLRQSFKQHPNLKSMIYWTRAIIAKKLASF